VNSFSINTRIRIQEQYVLSGRQRDPAVLTSPVAGIRRVLQHGRTQRLSDLRAPVVAVVDDHYLVDTGTGERGETCWKFLPTPISHHDCP
jgi:hypothetical protein